MKNKFRILISIIIFYMTFAIAFYFFIALVKITLEKGGVN